MAAGLQPAAASEGSELPRVSITDVCPDDLFDRLDTLPVDVLVLHRHRLETLVARVAAAPACASTYLTLPDVAIQNVAFVLASSDSFSWCATCRLLRRAQPRLQVLVIGDRCGVYGKWANSATLKDCFQVRVGSSSMAHRIIEKISPRHGAEISHLHVVAAQGWTWTSCGQLRIPTDNLSNCWVLGFSNYGSQLTALRCLHIVHPSTKYDNDAEQLLRPRASLEACATLLICKTSPTLRSLAIDAKCHMSCYGVLMDMSMLADLTFLRLNLVPSSPHLSGAAAASEARDTQRLSQAVSVSCRKLKHLPQVSCHIVGDIERHRGECQALAPLDVDAFIGE